MAIKTLRVFQEFTSEGYVPMPPAGNIDYGYTIAGTFPEETPTTFQLDDPDLDVEVTEMTDFYVWIRSHGAEWNINYTRNVRVYPDSPLINNVVMGIIIANLDYTVPYVGATENVDLGEFGLSGGFLNLDNTPTTANVPTTPGTLVWNDTEGTADLLLKGGNVTLQLGQEEVIRVVNKTGATLNEADFRAVRIRSVAEGGAQGQRLAVVLAQANNDPNSATTIGLVTESILTNEEGFITTSGNINKIDTTGAKSYGGTETWVDGDVLYLSPTYPGYLTKVKPQAPDHTIIIGWVVYAHANNGKIFVKVDNGYELDELHNVKITNPVLDDFLMYDTTLNVWKNKDMHGTKGYIPYFNDATLFLNSPFWTDGGLIGVNTITPRALMDLKGTTAYTKLIVDNNGATGGGMFSAYQNGAETAMFGTDAHYQANTSLDAAIAAKKAGGGIQFYTNGSNSEKVGINADGNMFVGQTPTWTSSATNFIVRGKTGAGHIGVMHYDMSIKGFMNTLNNVFQIGTSTFHSLAFLVENSERGRVNSSGRLLWGTTTDNGTDLVQINGSLVASSIKKSGGTSSQYLMADGSVSTLSGVITGSGTTNYVPKFTSASAIGNSSIQDSGSLITLGSNTYINGNLGIGGTTFTGFNGSNLFIGKAITGNANSNGVGLTATINSDVTGAAVGYRTELSTQAATFTLNEIRHYQASQGTIGAGSTVNVQFGFWVSNGLTGATNNYAYYSLLAAGTNRWNLYMNGTANNYLAGSLGIGSTTLAQYSLRVSKTITGANDSVGVFQNGSVQSDVTGTAYGFSNQLNTQATTFALTNYRHYSAIQNSIGAGNTITNQLGFYVDSGLTGATNNYGFYGNITSGTNRWNLFMGGTANNYLAGALGIGSISLTGISLDVRKSITGATTSYGINQNGAVQSDVTSAVYSFNSNSTTQAASFTLVNFVHYSAGQGTIGLGSTVTNQYGFFVSSNLTGATNNFGFRGAISSGTNRFNLYMDGTANNYLAGSLGIGATSLTGYNLRVSKNIAGAIFAYGISSEGAIQSDVTSAGVYYQTSAGTQATTFTVGSVYHYLANQGTFGAGSTVTNQYGFYVNSNLTGATNDYGFYGNLAAATGRWNLYMNGTAANYLNGSLLIGTTSDGGYKVNIVGTLNATALRITSGTSTQYLMGDGTTSTITDSFVTSKILTGLSISGTAVTSSDSILVAIGKIQNQLNGLSGSLSYRGTWNASTNNPSITSGVGTNGYFYIVSVAGTTNIDGTSSWAVGDWIIFNGTTWQKIATQSVTSVNGLTGAVTLTTSNIAEGSNLYFTNARSIGSTLTGFTSSSGTITSSDTVLTAIQKLNGNVGNLVTGVSSVFGRTGAIIAQSGDYNTSIVTEGSNLYFTNTRALNAIFTGTSAQFLKANGTTNEIITDLDANIVGDKNGVNTVYTLSNNYVSNSTRVFVNGVRMQLGASNDYIEINSNQIQFLVALDSGDILVVDYIK